MYQPSSPSMIRKDQRRAELEARFRRRLGEAAGQIERVAERLTAENGAGDCERLRKVAHRLAGTAAQFGHERIALTAAEVEKEAAQGNAAGAARQAIRLARQLREAAASE